MKHSSASLIAIGFRPTPQPWRLASVATSFINDPAIFSVVAEYEGRVVGSNFLDERDPIGASADYGDPSSKSAG